MKHSGIPFVWHNTKPENNGDDPASGMRLSALAEFHEGDYKGVIISGVVSALEGENRLTNYSGFSVAGAFNGTKGSFTGFGLAGIVNYVSQTLTGLQVGLFNFARRGDDFAQIGLVNRVKVVENELSGYLQIGLWNEAGGRSIPFLNYRKSPMDTGI